MALIGLLLLALVLLVVGLVTAGSIWFVASVVASLAAGYLLWRQRNTGSSGGREKDAPSAGSAPRQTTLVTGTAFTTKADGGLEPSSHDGISAVGTTAVGTTAVGTAVGGIVVGGTDVGGASDEHHDPAHHDPAHHDPANHDPAHHDPHATGAHVPDDIAGNVTDDVPGAEAAAGAQARSAPTAADDVWVVDGRPEFHARGCAHLTGDGELIPRDQAVEDGFRPCADCRPDGAAPADSSEWAAVPAPAHNTAYAVPGPAGPAAGPAASPADSDPTAVWVVDGRPRYHAGGCQLLEGLDAERIPRDQADDDGFIPCAMCTPQAVRV